MTAAMLPGETSIAPLRHLERRFLGRLFASPRGRSFFLNLMADAEVSDEGRVFEALLARVDDPELAKLVKKHRDDEVRHNAILLECVARTGIDPGPVPDELRFTHRLDRELGGFAEAFVGGEEDVMRAYLMLLVLEKRAVQRYPYIVRALEPVDPASAKVVAEVLADEERHVRYARAIARRYAPDQVTLAREVRRFEAAEARALAEQGEVLLGHLMEHDLMAVGSLEKLLWRGVAAVGVLHRRRTAAVATAAA